jgi:hypothetical protein
MLGGDDERAPRDTEDDDREWRILGDLFPEGHDDRWMDGDWRRDHQSFPVPIGYP